jgi:hypothetical protein
MPNPHSFVRIRSLVAFVAKLLAQVKKTAGQRLTDLGDSQHVSSGPDYWFAGQVTVNGELVEVAPLWVQSGSDLGAPAVPVSGAVACPTPGVVSLVVRHRVSWQVVGELIEETAVFEGASLVGGSSPAAAVQAMMTFAPPQDELPLEILGQSNQSVTVIVLATLDTQRRVSHVARSSGGGGVVGQGLRNVVANRNVSTEARE